ncbi:hypothetical protein EMIT013CA1_40078 [Bacillus sp. IT-13CA1]
MFITIVIMERIDLQNNKMEDHYVIHNYKRKHLSRFYRVNAFIKQVICNRWYKQSFYHDGNTS